MALGAPALAHAPARGRGVTARRGLLALALAWAGAAAASAGDVRAVIAPHLGAQAAGAVGEVHGVASGAGRRPADPPRPLEGVIVYLLPLGSELEEELDRVKRTYRDGGPAYLQAAARLEEARERYERALRLAGGGELVRGEVSDEQGRFRFATVPAGRWTLLAWRADPHALSPRRLAGAEVREFRGNPERRGYTALTYWRRALDVGSGLVVEVALHDRNEWMTAVVEQVRIPDADGRAAPKRDRGATR